MADHDPDAHPDPDPGDGDATGSPRLHVDRYGPDPVHAALTVVAVHGRDQDPAILRRQIVDPLRAMGGGVESVVAATSWILPAAPGRRWYPESHRAPLAANEPDLTRSLDALASIDEGLAAQGVAATSVLWLGFSQGACLVSEYLARRPGPRAGLIVCTGGRIGPPSLDWSITGDYAAMPASFSFGAHDPWIDARRVHDTAAAFAAAGADVSVEIHDDDIHDIRPAEIRGIGEFLATIAGRR